MEELNHNTESVSADLPASYSSTTDIMALNELIHKESAFIDLLILEMNKVIIGQQYMIERLMIGLLSDGHILLEGVPGLAKTLAINTLSKAIDAGFSRIQFTPDLLPADLVGTMIYNQKKEEFIVRKGPVFSNFILADEINRAPAKVQSALLEAMQERQVTIGDQTFKLPDPFLVLATQNPIEQEGTYRLPEAQLDRFLFKIEVKYPSLEEESQILIQQHQQKTEEKAQEIKSVLNALQIIELRNRVRKLFVKPELLQFTAQIIHATRNSNSLYLGASPRASLALVNSAKALAAMDGRDFVNPDDIIRAVNPVLRHRIMLTPDKEMEGISPDEVLNQIVQQIEVPR